MSYFKLSTTVAIKPYPFDFHSHFSGILPLESEITWDDDQDFKEGGLTIKKGDELSIIEMIAREINKENKLTIAGAKVEAHYRLFSLVLKNIIGNNPFYTKEIGDYQRGECAAENIYIACALMLQNMGVDIDYAINKPEIYDITFKLLNARDSKIKTRKNEHIVTYFNRKIFTANKYTPFDDAYWARSVIQDEEAFRKIFNWTTLCYLYASGIRYTQIAVSVSAIKNGLNEYFRVFNNNKHTSYKLLAHSQHVYSDKDKFEKQLNEILDLFKIENSESGKAKYDHLVGIDLLSPEIRTALYQDFFKFLDERRNVFANYVDQAGAPCKKIIIHIHCGEGSSISGENRSLSGYYLAHASTPDAGKFSKFLAAYVKEGYQYTLSNKEARERDRDNLDKRKKEYLEISSLFDELFFLTGLSFMGLQLRRFDICSQLSQDLVVFNAKTNITHLCAQLENTASDDKSYYESLCDSVPFASNTPYSFRIGHAYYDRNYVTSRFPALYFDTNLGSNFITGASGLFNSAQIYRLNSGFRHLNGQIDSDILEKATNMVAYMGIDRLNEQQSALVTKNHFDDDDYKKLGLIGTTKDAARTFLNAYWETDAPLDEKLKHRRFLLLALVVNWRSYIFGADGQGVEHSDVKVESARMALMLAYQLTEALGGEISDRLIHNLVEFFRSLSRAYWELTIEEHPHHELIEHNKYKIEQFQGFKSPQSVVLVKAGRELNFRSLNPFNING